MKKQRAIIVDLDGTLFNSSHRVKYLLQEPKDWDNFYASIKDDTIVNEVHNIIQYYMNDEYIDYRLLFVTGRDMKYSEPTINKLLEHEYYFDEYNLYMRPEGDRRPDYEVKEEIYNKYIKDNYDVVLVLEDRTSVVNKWRELGLTCFQVAPGDF